MAACLAANQMAGGLNLPGRTNCQRYANGLKIGVEPRFSNYPVRPYSFSGSTPVLDYAPPLFQHCDIISMEQKPVTET